MALGLALLWQTPVWAGGWLVGENGSQALQRAGAFTARADDGTALAINPAGLMSVQNVEGYLGLGLVHMSESFQRAGSYAPQAALAGPTQPGYVGAPFPQVSSSGNQFIPFAVGAGKVGPVVLALGAFGPHAFPGRDFPATVTVNGVDAPAPQRYDKIFQESIVVQPSVAAAIRALPWLDIGARLTWGIGRVRTIDTIQGSPDGDVRATETRDGDGQTTIEANDFFIPNGGIGLKARAGDNFEFGLAWNSAIPVHATGTINLVPGALVTNPLGPMQPFTQVLAPVPADKQRCHDPDGQNPGACVDIDLPQSLAFGVRYVFRDAPGEPESGDIEFDVKWENWSSSSDFVIRTDAQGIFTNTMTGASSPIPINDLAVKHGMKDVLSLRLGGQWTLPVGQDQLHLRGGVAYETPSADESWSRVDIDGAPRATLAGGIGFQGKTWRVDGGVAYVKSFDRNVQDVPLADSGNVSSRVQPDIAYPLADMGNQPYHPFNAGSITTSYFIADVAVSLWW